MAKCNNCKKKKKQFNELSDSLANQMHDIESLQEILFEIQFAIPKKDYQKIEKLLEKLELKNYQTFESIEEAKDPASNKLPLEERGYIWTDE